MVLLGLGCGETECVVVIMVLVRHADDDAINEKEKLSNSASSRGYFGKTARALGPCSGAHGESAQVFFTVQRIYTTERFKSPEKDGRNDAGVYFRPKQRECKKEEGVEEITRIETNGGDGERVALAYERLKTEQQRELQEPYNPVGAAQTRCWGSIVPM